MNAYERTNLKCDRYLTENVKKNYLQSLEQDVHYYTPLKNRIECDGVTQ